MLSVFTMQGLLSLALHITCVVPFLKNLNTVLVLTKLEVLQVRESWDEGTISVSFVEAVSVGLLGIAGEQKEIKMKRSTTFRIALQIVMHVFMIQLPRRKYIFFFDLLKTPIH